MKKIINKTKLSLFLTFTCAVLSALLLFGLVYLIEDNAVQLREQVNTISYNKAQQRERYETERLLMETQEERTSLNNFVLTENSVIDFINNIETIADSLGLEFKTQSITPEETKDPDFDELSMKFDFSGTKEAGQHMISILETIPYHSYIRDLSVRQNEDTKMWNVNLVLVVTIAIYDK